jgi:GNAT superfamily N-acetyltransferase
MHQKGSKSERFGNLLKHGLVLEAVLQRLKKIGIEINILSFLKENINEGMGVGFAARFKSYTVGPLTSEDMESIATQRGWRDAAYYRSELAAGKLCFGAKLDNQLASFTWVNLKECKYSGIIRPLKDKQAYIYDSYTFPAFRGRGLAPFVRNECYKALDQLGIKTLYSVSSYFNKPAITFKKKLGATSLRIEIQIVLLKKFRWLFTKNHKN